MKRFWYSLLGAFGVLVLALVLTAIGPKRVLAALGFTPVRDVNAPGREPFQITFNNTTLSSFHVPANKRLVIEYVSATTGGAFDAFIDIATTAGGVSNNYVFPFTVSNSLGGGITQQYLNNVVKIYADPSTFIGFSDASNNVATSVSISGYYLDVP